MKPETRNAKPETSPLYLGLDFGTSGCRAVAIDHAGAVHGQAEVALPEPLRRGGEVEQSPALWGQALEQVLDTLLSSFSPQRIAAIAVDGTSGTVLLTDSAGEALGPALMYNDARAADEAARVAACAPAESAAHGASAGLAKLLWLQGHTDTRKAVHLMSQADWVAGRLCGVFGVSDVNNMLKLGYDPITQSWPDWLDGLEVPRRWLPRVVTPGTTLGPLRPEMAARFGLPRTTRVVAGTTDSTAAFIATGAAQPCEAVTSLGSTLVMKVLAQKPVFAPQYGVYSQPLGGLWLVGGSSNSGGAVLRQHFSDVQMAALTPELRPDEPSGLDYYPLPAPGERFPRNDPNLAPRLSPRPAEAWRFFQGMLEGMARIEAESYRLLAQLGAPYPLSVRSVGGGAKNGPWCRMRERELGVAVLRPEHGEAAYGSALLARGTR